MTSKQVTRTDFRGKPYTVTVVTPTDKQMARLNRIMDDIDNRFDGRIKTAFYRTEFVNFMDNDMRGGFLDTLDKF